MGHQVLLLVTSKPLWCGVVWCAAGAITDWRYDQLAKARMSCVRENTKWLALNLNPKTSCEPRLPGAHCTAMGRQLQSPAGPWSRRQPFTSGCLPSPLGEGGCAHYLGRATFVVAPVCPCYSWLTATGHGEGGSGALVAHGHTAGGTG